MLHRENNHDTGSSPHCPVAVLFLFRLWTYIHRQLRIQLPCANFIGQNWSRHHFASDLRELFNIAQNGPFLQAGAATYDRKLEEFLKVPYSNHGWYLLTPAQPVAWLAGLKTECVAYSRPLAGIPPAEHMRSQPKLVYEGVGNRGHNLKFNTQQPSAPRQLCHTDVSPSLSNERPMPLTRTGSDLSEMDTGIRPMRYILRFRWGN